MEPGPAPQIPPATNDARDLFFKCHQCGVSLVVDRAAAGMTLTCQHCGKPTPVPTSGMVGNLTNEPSEKVAELQRRLNENESQRTEVTGYINQLNNQLHRWQLRLQMLDDRKQELSDELARVRAAGASQQS